MKSFYKVSTILLTITALSACTVKSTNSKVTSAVSNSSNGSSTTDPATIPPVTGGNSCDGVYHDGATSCYYKNIPTIQASGGVYGQTWWSSTNFISSTGNSPGQFSSDYTFNVRIIPRSPTANATSTFGKVCSPYKMYATKIKVQLMMHKYGVSLGEVATLTSTIGAPSNVYHFTVPRGTGNPLILEVVNVSSNSRCTGFYGSNPSNCSTNPYLDIPINTLGPTECVAFDIQYSTDETYDLPGPTAN
ncbi:MAG: hypothetical protein Q7U04_08260 [Bacteriovorax sp.]|nr:hypothetical protein [Bacteriovorax sp.]